MEECKMKAVEFDKLNDNKERGASLVEYAILVGIIVAVGIAAVTGFGSSITAMFGRISADIDQVAP